MKDPLNIPVSKLEDQAALKIRRENYAVGRDQHAAEFNEAIAKRIIAESRINQKCLTCGKEFRSEKANGNLLTCPGCTDSTEVTGELLD